MQQHYLLEECPRERPPISVHNRLERLLHDFGSPTTIRNFSVLHLHGAPLDNATSNQTTIVKALQTLRFSHSALDQNQRTCSGSHQEYRYSPTVGDASPPRNERRCSDHIASSKGVRATAIVFFLFATFFSTSRNPNNPYFMSASFQVSESLLSTNDIPDASKVDLQGETQPPEDHGADCLA
ncbi:MAG: hypothetical protein J3Q66DRAFT_369389 [Benniella sp.]|nr:MAG: hypothetical protein J3Q66DRAFT_369389 [Benniella sp.]